jgi:protein-tyrosine-phosphatase/predicted ATP-grasp superfamily ATP-dependent carboligase
MPLTKRVLVLGSDTRSFLSVVRSLGRGGLTVDSAWTAPSAVARHSKYLRHVLDDLPEYSPKDPAWLDALQRRIAQNGYDLVVPTCDPAILPLQAHRQELDARRFYLLEDKAFEITNDKGKTYDLARSEGVPVPDQALVHTLAEAELAAAQFGYPVILKLTSSFTLQDSNNKQYVQRAADRQALRHTLESMLPKGAVLMQSYFQGIGVGVEILARAGKILASFQHQRVHEPLRGGGSSYRMSVPLHPGMLEATKKLIHALNYTGVAMVEFRFDPARDRFVLIEINGRFWGSLPLAIAAGADFPLWLYQMWVEGRDEFPGKARVGLYCRNLLNDLDWMAENVRAGREAASSEALPTATVVGELWHFVTLRERFDTLVLDDLGPGIEELRLIVRRFVDRAHKLLLTSKLFAGWRSLARWTANRRLRKARKLLFVCKGNICRSPFAAAYASRMLPGVEINSAGYYPVAKRASPAEAVTAAASFGTDLSQRRSSVVDEELIKDADAVVIFDYENYATLRSAYPASKGKMLFLGLLDGEAAFIEDPYGGKLQDFVATYSRIVRAVDRISQTRRVT